jgi:hypothetical protein
MSCNPVRRRQANWPHTGLATVDSPVVDSLLAIRHKYHQVLFFQLITVSKIYLTKYFFGLCCYLRADFRAPVQLQIETSSDYFTTRTRLARRLARRELDDSLLHVDYFHCVKYSWLNAARIRHIDCVFFIEHFQPGVVRLYRLCPLHDLFSIRSR